MHPADLLLLLVCSGQQLVPPQTNACNRNGKRDSTSGISHFQLASEPFEQANAGLTADHTHHNGLCRFTDAEQVEHFRARRAVCHTHKVHRRLFLTIDTQHLFALLHVNNGRYDLYRALHRHLRSVFTHALLPPKR